MAPDQCPSRTRGRAVRLRGDGGRGRGAAAERGGVRQRAGGAAGRGPVHLTDTAYGLQYFRYIFRAMFTVCGIFHWATYELSGIL